MILPYLIVFFFSVAIFLGHMTAGATPVAGKVMEAGGDGDDLVQVTEARKTTWSRGAAVAAQTGEEMESRLNQLGFGKEDEVNGPVGWLFLF